MHGHEHQLRVIAELQRHLLPRSLPRPSGWNMAVHYSVGPWPGGDFYDAVEQPDGGVLLLIADASGHGGPSTVLVALTRAVMHTCPLSSGTERLPFCPFRNPLLQPPHIVLGHLNRVLFENSLEEQFMTAILGRLTPRDGTLKFACAGHQLPRWWHAATQSVAAVPDVAGIPLGILAEVPYATGNVEIAPGDVLVFYTDGLTEAQNAEGVQFGTARLDEALRASAVQGVEAVKSTVLARLRDFLAGGQPHDDITLLVLGREA